MTEAVKVSVPYPSCQVNQVNECNGNWISVFISHHSNISHYIPLWTYPGPFTVFVYTIVNKNQTQNWVIFPIDERHDLVVCFNNQKIWFWGHIVRKESIKKLAFTRYIKSKSKQMKADESHQSKLEIYKNNKHFYFESQLSLFALKMIIIKKFTFKIMLSKLFNPVLHVNRLWETKLVHPPVFSCKKGWLETQPD